MDIELFQQMRQDYTGRLLQQAFRDFSNRAIARLRQRGHSGLTLAHTLLLSHLDLEGTHITVLADRAGITKQSMGQLVLDLEKRRYIERRADPSDRRATLVFFTSMGWQFLRDAFEVRKEIEAEYQAMVGKQEMEQFHRTLRRLLAQTASQGHEAPPV
jgi:DNA-binding MarR family transcriptional regulator